MSDIREHWRSIVAGAVSSLLPEGSAPLQSDQITMEVPPNPEMGDVGFPLFPFAKLLRVAPAKIAADVHALLQKNPALKDMGAVKIIGPYINVFLPKDKIAEKTLRAVIEQGKNYGKTESLKGKKIMVEFSSPNTNKPLHLGHLRNDAIGESISRIFEFCGADVYKVNIINDRGVHICKSMLAYMKFADGKTPESLGIKPDRFVGEMYVRFNTYSKENPEKAEQEAQELLRSWEAGDKPEVLELWRKMNDWAIQGIKQTYERTGVSFDKLYFESETYLKGREEVLEGLAKGLFYKEEDGSIWVDLSPIKLDKKVLLRGDGTALYITQDFGTAIFRHNDWPFDRLIYVVGNEQEYHFKVLFYVLGLLGYDWAKNLYHLSYGMVNLPEGKMKSREGTIVDADDLINSLRDAALAEIEQKGRSEAVGDPKEVAEKIALAALHYFLLQVSPKKDMLFNPQESLSFNGNTGPYLQYMGARITSILKKAETEEGKQSISGGSVKPALLTHESEWTLLKTIEDFPQQVSRAADQYDSSIVTAYLYELSKNFSRFYHDCPILSAGNADLAVTRLELARAVKIVLENAARLVLVPFLEVM